MTTRDLVVIRTFVNAFDAEVARTALDAAGIAAMIRADDCGGVRPHLWMGGVELLVRAEDVELADEILSTPARPERVSGSGGSGPQPS
jgi:hypothetical protein